MQSDPDLTLSVGQQFLRDAQTRSGYDEVPMAGVVRIVMFKIGWTVGFVIAVAVAGVIMMLMAIEMPMWWFFGILVVRLCYFDMDVRKMISRMAVPHGGAGPRGGTGIEQ